MVLAMRSSVCLSRSPIGPCVTKPAIPHIRSSYLFSATIRQTQIQIGILSGHPLETEALLCRRPRFLAVAAAQFRVVEIVSQCIRERRDIPCHGHLSGYTVLDQFGIAPHPGGD